MERTDLEALIRTHQGIVYTIVLSYVQDPHTADDLSQEVFIQAMRALDGVRDPSSIRVWLGRIARNKAIDHLRSRRITLALPPDRPQPQNLESDPDRLKAVERVLQGLKEDYRRIIQLRYVQGLSYAEIGKIVGLRPTAVGEKLHRVLQLVIREYKEACNEL